MVTLDLDGALPHRAARAECCFQALEKSLPLFGCHMEAFDDSNGLASSALSLEPEDHALQGRFLDLADCVSGRFLFPRDSPVCGVNQSRFLVRHASIIASISCPDPRYLRYYIGHLSQGARLAKGHSDA